MKIIKYWVLLLFLIFLIGLCLTQAGPKTQEWHSPLYEIQLSYHYTSQCNPGYCEGEKILEFVANVYNVAFGHSLTPDFPCWYYDSELGVTLPLWGHSDGDAQVTDVEICPHLSGAGVEPQNIVNRNNNFTINLSILPRAMVPVPGHHAFFESGIRMGELRRERIKHVFISLLPSRFT